MNVRMRIESISCTLWHKASIKKTTEANNNWGFSLEESVE
jgi:hypothetical protein